MRDRAEEFEAAGCAVAGVSFDEPADNAAFAAAQGFPFPLLSDLGHEVGRSYEAARPPGEPDVPLRVSYLIDPEGVVRRSYEVTDVAGHAGQVLADLADLTG